MNKIIILSIIIASSILVSHFSDATNQHEHQKEFGAAGDTSSSSSNTMMHSLLHTKNSLLRSFQELRSAHFLSAGAGAANNHSTASNDDKNKNTGTDAELRSDNNNSSTVLPNNNSTSAAPISWKHISGSIEETFIETMELRSHTYQAFWVHLDRTSTDRTNIDIVVNLQESAVCEEAVYVQWQLRTPPPLLPWTVPSDESEVPGFHDLFKALLVLPVEKSMMCVTTPDIQKSFQKIVPRDEQDLFVIIQSRSQAHRKPNFNHTTTTTAAPGGGGAPPHVVTDPPTHDPHHHSQAHTIKNKRCQVNLFLKVDKTSKWEMDSAFFLVGTGILAFGFPLYFGLVIARRPNFQFNPLRRLMYVSVLMFFPSVVFYLVTKNVTRLTVFLYEYFKGAKCCAICCHNRKRLSRKKAASSAASASAANNSNTSAAVPSTTAATAPATAASATTEGSPTMSDVSLDDAATSSNNTTNIQRSPQASTSTSSTAVTVTVAAAAPTHVQQIVSRQSAEEEEEEIICRICADDDEEEELLTPCNCTGSCAYVHQTCLDKWRVQSSNQRVQRSASCEICLAPFRVPVSRAAVARMIALRVLYFFTFFVAAFSVIVGSFGVQAYIVGPMGCAAPFEKTFHGPLDNFSVYIVGCLTYMVITLMVYVAVQISWIVWYNAPEQELAAAQENLLHRQQRQQQQNNNDNNANNNNNNNNDGENAAVAPGNGGDNAAREEGAEQNVDNNNNDGDGDNAGGGAVRVNVGVVHQRQQQQQQQHHQQNEDAAADVVDERQELLGNNNNNNNNAGNDGNNQHDHDDDDEENNRQQQQRRDDDIEADAAAARLLERADRQRARPAEDFFVSRATRVNIVFFVLWQFDCCVFVCMLYKWILYQHRDDIAWSWSVPFPVLVIASIVIAFAIMILSIVVTVIKRAIEGEPIHRPAGDAADDNDDDDDEAHEGEEGNDNNHGGGGAEARNNAPGQLENHRVLPVD